MAMITSNSQSLTHGAKRHFWLFQLILGGPASRNTLKMVHVNGLCHVRNSAQGTMLGGHQVVAVFCCKSICRLVTLSERCFRTVACMCVDVRERTNTSGTLQSCTNTYEKLMCAMRSCDG